MTQQYEGATGVNLPAARASQATVVEQTRAAAEVAAAVQVAQQCPRNVQAAIAEMRESCKQLGLAERAFFRFPRGGTQVSGASVYLARELARCWGNVQYGIAELSRNDGELQSEMIAFAWDVQTNTRNSSTFIVPHKRDTKDGPKPLIDMRDVYENNANQGARRVREAIFAILPPWFLEEAKTLCAETLRNGGGIPLSTRIANCLHNFGAIGVTPDQLEQKVGRPSGKWNEHDAAQLAVIYTSIQRGEARIEEEFPQQRVTAAEILGDRPISAPTPDPAEASKPWPEAKKPGGQ